MGVHKGEVSHYKRNKLFLLCLFAVFSVLAYWVSMELERPPHFVCSPVIRGYPVEMPTSILTGKKIYGICFVIMFEGSGML